MSASTKSVSVSSSVRSADAAPSATISAIYNTIDAGSSQDSLNLTSFRTESPPLFDSFQVDDLRTASTSCSSVTASSKLAATLQNMASAPSTQLSSSSTQPPSGVPLEQYWPQPLQASFQIPFTRLQQEQLPQKAEAAYRQKPPPSLYKQHHPKEKKTTGADLPTAAALTAGAFSGSSDNETGSSGGGGSDRSSPENAATF